MQGLQDLKYSPDENTPEELAKNYKEDGNFNFKCKKYRFATASYTEGLKVKCGVKEIETALLTNRAAAQFHVGNYRSSLIDCRSFFGNGGFSSRVLCQAKYKAHMLNQFAIQTLNVQGSIGSKSCAPEGDHKSSSMRGKAQPVLRGSPVVRQVSGLNNADLLNSPDRGLEVEKTEQLTEMRAEYSAKAKQVERDLRKRAAKEKKIKEESAALLDAVKKRGVEVGILDIRVSLNPLDKVNGGLTMETLEPLHPAAVQRKVSETRTNYLLLCLSFKGEIGRWQVGLARALPLSGEGRD